MPAAAAYTTTTAAARPPLATMACPQCNTAQSRFFCSNCLSERIVAHRANMDRIKAARAKAAQRIEDILQGRTVADVVVGDPDDDAAQMSTFTQRAPGADVPTSAELVRPQAHPQPAFVRGPSGNPRTTAFSSSPSSVVTTSSSASTLSKSNVGPTHCPGATHVARIRRARIAALTARVDALHRATAEAREDGSRVQERVLEQRALLERRRRNLADARILLAEREPGLAEDQWTHPSEKPLGLGPGAWPGDVKPHRDGFGVLFEPPRTLEMVRRELDLRKNEAKELAEELAHTRAILAREAYSIFVVQPPPGSASAPFASPSSRALAERARLQAQRSRERYGQAQVPGAFEQPEKARAGAMDEGGKGLSNESKNDALMTADGTGKNPNDWTIVGLVLPSPGDLRRFPRDTINGAVAHTVHLLQLLSSYLGVALPFSLGVQGGKASIRPSSLWSGPSSTKQAFHLSSAAYGALTAPITSSGSSGASGASTLGLSLGASTLSTLESFVQLPGGAHLASWGLGSVITSQPSGPSSSPTSKTESGRPESEKELVGKSKSDPAGVAAKGFCAALVMLKYDVAYLAHTQGVRVDLLGAAGSSLRLLARTLASGELGRKSHATHHPQAHIRDLSFHLDFAQLNQVHEPACTNLNPSATSSSSSPDSKTIKDAPSSPSTKKAYSPARLPSQARAMHTPTKLGRANTAPVMGIGMGTGMEGMIEESYIDAGQAAASVLHSPSGAQPNDNGKGNGNGKEQSRPLGVKDQSSNVHARPSLITRAQSAAPAPAPKQASAQARDTTQRRTEPPTQTRSRSSTHTHAQLPRRTTALVSHVPPTASTATTNLNFLRLRGKAVAGAGTGPSRKSGAGAATDPALAGKNAGAGAGAKGAQTAPATNRGSAHSVSPNAEDGATSTLAPIKKPDEERFHTQGQGQTQTQTRPSANGSASTSTSTSTRPSTTGRQASTSSGSNGNPQPQAHAHAHAGAVIFNGVEIGVREEEDEGEEHAARSQYNPILAQQVSGQRQRQRQGQGRSDDKASAKTKMRNAHEDEWDLV